MGECSVPGATVRPSLRRSVLAWLGPGLPLIDQLLTLAFLASRRELHGSALARLALTLVLVGLAWWGQLWARCILVFVLAVAAPLAVVAHAGTERWPLVVFSLLNALAAVCLFAAWGPTLQGPVAQPRRTGRTDEPPLPDPS
jgi:hypothetical protein